MPYCQILVLSATNGTNILLPGLMGRVKIRVLSLQFHSTTGGGVHPTIVVQSDKLRFVYGYSPYLTFISNASTNLTLDNSNKEMMVNEVFMDGAIYIHVIDLATGNEPAGFTQLIINLDVEDLNTKLVL